MKNFIVIVAATLCTSASAEFFNGNELLTKLRGDTTSYLQGLGYITGVYDTMRNVGHCPPSGVTAGQIVDMVRLHLEQSPSTRHHSADTHVMYVLMRAWPCQNRQQSGRSS